MLPFPCHLRRLQIVVDAACPFCLESEVTDHHILVTCREVAAIWKVYAAAARAPVATGPLTSSKLSGCKDIRFILPGLLSWNIWKAYNACLHSHGRFTKEGLLAATNQLLQQWFWAKYLDTSSIYKSNVFSFGIHTFCKKT